MNIRPVVVLAFILSLLPYLASSVAIGAEKEHALSLPLVAQADAPKPVATEAEGAGFETPASETKTLAASAVPVAPPKPGVADTKTADAKPATVAIPAVNEFVDFDYPITDGLYATVTAMTSFKKPNIKAERKLKLKDIEGFKKEIQVRAVIQDQPAPLAVIFLGLASKSKDPLARLWQAQLQEAGCHVLVFDSVFRPSFNECSRHGVAGNLDVEARVAARVIASFMQHPEMEGKVEKVGLIGASYGGMLALNFERLASKGDIKIIPERVLAFSPPVNMQVSAVQLDKFYAEYKQDYGLFDLLKLSGHEPVEDGKPIPFSPGLMRAGIGYIFHADLKDAIDCSRECYNYSLPKEDDKDKKNLNAFTRFIEGVVYPYWEKQGVVRSLEELWQFGDLYRLMKNTSDKVHVVITEDDPLNDPKLIDYLRRDFTKQKITILPRGGHLGFLGSNWAKKRVQSLFNQ